MHDAVATPGLLTATDPPPVEWCRRSSAVPILLLCEHAGQAVPAALGDLGLAPGEIDRHIGWDVGAEALARAVSDRLEAPLILQRYSRLVIDCNRPPGAATSIPDVSDSITVPANHSLTQAQRSLREKAIFDPLNAAISAGFAAHPRRMAFSIHSYTRTFAGQPRSWDAGFLARHDTQTAQGLMAHIAQAAPDLVLGLNQPYQIDDSSDWFIPHHAEPRGVRHTLIEVCNDQLRDASGVAVWADLLSDAIAALSEEKT